MHWTTVETGATKWPGDRHVGIQAYTSLDNWRTLFILFIKKQHKAKGH